MAGSLLSPDTVDTALDKDYRRKFHECGIALLDVDGVLVRNEPFHVASWIKLSESCGVHLTDAMFDQEHEIHTPEGIKKQKLRGSHPDVIIHWIYGKMPSNMEKLPLDKMKAQFKSHLLKNLREKAEPSEGIEDTIEALHNKGFIVGTVTGSDKDIYQANLSALKKIPKLLDFEVSAEETTGKKPDPAPYILGLKKVAGLMGIDNPTPEQLASLAKRSFSVEDGHSGVKSSLNADIPCVQFISPSQARFTDMIKGRPVEDWVFVAIGPEALRKQINKVTRRFAPPAPQIS